MQLGSVQRGNSIAADNRDRKILGNVSLLQSSACTCGDCELMSKAIHTTNRIGLYVLYNLNLTI
mgnify:CR=1 FL=1